LPGFLNDRRNLLVSRLEMEGQARQVLLAIAAIDGWYLNKNLYRKVAGDGLVDSVTAQTVFSGVMAMVDAL
jgi:hypothetical protein